MISNTKNLIRKLTITNNTFRLNYLKYSTFLTNSNKSRSRNILLPKKFNFSERDFSEDDSHSDFKPKSKIQINDSNVMQVIDDWVQNNKVVLFMKGTREMPRCGFSNYACQVLKFYNIQEVKCVNILEDNLVREAVKQYSNWPTYPQLYVKGSLVGIY